DQFDAELRRLRRQQRLHGAAGGVAFRLQRQRAARAFDGGDAHARRTRAGGGDAVVGTGEAVSEQVEADADIAHRGRRAGGGTVRRAHSGAPSAAATRSTSANTPAAVTSGPAPGPRTISGLSQ